MWRNVYYERSKSKIHEWTWDEDGNRVKLVSDFKPYLFVETNKETKFKSIYGGNLSPMDFKSDFERRKFVEKQDDDYRLFYNLPAEQQYLIGKYRKEDPDNFSKREIRTFYLDIECPSPDEFPEAKDAKYEIDLMAIYDSLEGRMHMWGKRAWDRKNTEEHIEKLGGDLVKITADDISYYHIEDEKERLSHMLDFWEDNCPDVYTGYNIDSFDTPYLLNRMQLILDKNEYKRLSPVRNVWKQNGFDKNGEPEIRYKIQGISTLDYMSVFETFTFKAERESWSLDSVASDVLNCGKVDYEQSNLYVLAQEDWDTYSAYNMIDVLLLVSIETKTNFLDTGRATAYVGFTNFVDCLKKTRVIIGSITCSALAKGKIIETRRPQEKVSFEGGFVTPPKVGVADNVATYDVTSLYPTIMKSLNLSLETKVGKILSKDSNYIIFSEHGKRKKVETKKFQEYLKGKGYCISIAEVIFDQNFEGVVTDFVKKQFNNKSEFKRLENEAIDRGDKEAARIYKRDGQITKILVNSCYGVISLNTSALYDLDIARSITLTGQHSIKKAASVANNFAKEAFGVENDIILGGDTDSIFVTFSEILEVKGKDMFEDDKLSTFGDKLCKLFSKVLNDSVNNWARKDLCCVNPSFEFGREKAASVALFFAKKQYAYYVINNEGKHIANKRDRMKYTGLKVIKSEYSPFVKNFMDEVYYLTLSKYLELGHNGTRDLIAETIKGHKNSFYEADFIDVSKRQRANNLTMREQGGQKVNKKGGFTIYEPFKERYVSGKGCPAQVKACIFHNRLIEDLDLGSKYPIHMSGVKSMWTYLKPNKYGIECCAGNNGILPEEFGLEVDYDVQWDKLYMKVPQQLFEVMGWVFPNLFFDELEDFDKMFT